MSEVEELHAEVKRLRHLLWRFVDCFQTDVRWPHINVCIDGFGHNNWIYGAVDEKTQKVIRAAKDTLSREDT